MRRNLNLRRSIALPEPRQFEAMTRLCNASIENHLVEMHLTQFYWCALLVQLSAILVQIELFILKCG